jgi:hypothetical protein
VAWAVVPLVAACGAGSEGDPGGGGTAPILPVPTRVEITTVKPRIPAGGTTTLAARVLDQTGAPISGAPIVWSSRDPTTATIDAATGLLRGVAGGEVAIEARSGTLSGDVAALVHYEVAQDEAKVRFRAAGERLWDRAEGSGVFADVLGSDRGDWSALLLDDYDNGDDVLELTAMLPGRLATGETRVTSPDLSRLWDDAFPTEPFVLLVSEVREDSEVWYLSTDGRIELELVEVPAGAGLRKGWFRGRLIANLTDYSVSGRSRDPTVTPLGHKATVYADFWTGLYHSALPSVSLEFTGGPYPGPMGVEDGSFREEPYEPGEGIFVFGLAQGGSEVGDLRIHKPGLPEVGVWSLTFNDGDYRSDDSFAAVNFYPANRSEPFWYSESGELRIDLAAPPTADDLTGEVRGSIVAAFREEIDRSARMSVSGSFHVPWYSAGYRGASPARTSFLRRMLAFVWPAPR